MTLEYRNTKLLLAHFWVHPNVSLYPEGAEPIIKSLVFILPDKNAHTLIPKLFNGDH
jgi:hypothetical protein